MSFTSTSASQRPNSFCGGDELGRRRQYRERDSQRPRKRRRRSLYAINQHAVLCNALERLAEQGKRSWQNGSEGKVGRRDELEKDME